MKDRVLQDIGTEGELQNWSDINWKTVKKRIRNLRQRIYRATELGQWNKVRSLMKLMVRSYSNLLLSIRRVTQENQGKNTAGIDNQTVKTPQERVKLLKEMTNHELWKASPTKRVYIPKANGKRRPLGIPTIKDRVAQAVVKNALEPIYESKFEENSYGFRPGRSAHDALSQVWIRLQKGRDEWVLDADIKGAFDNISHNYILETIGNLPSKNLIKQWLKAGYIEKEIFYKTDNGTPQGGIISPLLATIALDGIEEELSRYYDKATYIRKAKCRTGQKITRKITKYGYIRYADDFIVTAKMKEDIEAIIPVIREWLKQRGLEFNPEKTQIVHKQEGFNFLGFNVRSYNRKLLVKPQKEKVKLFLNGIRIWLKSHATAKPEEIIRHLNPIIRGWCNYYRNFVSAKTFNDVENEIWKAVWKWCLRRHPKKGKKWVYQKYYRIINGRSGTFTTKIQTRTGKDSYITLMRAAEVKIIRHIKVKGKSAPDNPSLKEYWQQRQTKYGKNYFDQGTKHYRVVARQKWQCPSCGESLFNGEELHLHHVIPINQGGNDGENNLKFYHHACHRNLHGKTSQTQIIKA